MKNNVLQTYLKIRFTFIQLRNICFYLRSSAVCFLKSDHKNHKEHRGHRENWQRTQRTRYELTPLEFVLVRTRSLFYSIFQNKIISLIEG